MGESAILMWTLAHFFFQRGFEAQNYLFFIVIYSFNVLIWSDETWHQTKLDADAEIKEQSVGEQTEEYAEDEENGKSAGHVTSTSKQFSPLSQEVQTGWVNQ